MERVRKHGKLVKRIDSISSTTNPNPAGSTWLWRFVWLAMLLFHAKPLAAAILPIFGSTLIDEPALSPLRALILILSSIFFILKIVDVGWLRFRTDSYSIVSWLIVVSLLHLGPISRAAEAGDSQAAAKLGVVITLAGTLGLASIAVVRLCRSSLSSVKNRPLDTLLPETVIIGAAVLCDRVFVLCIGPRAPPAYSSL